MTSHSHIDMCIDASETPFIQLEKLCLYVFK